MLCNNVYWSFFYYATIVILSNFLKVCFQMLTHLYFFLSWPPSFKIFFISSGNYTSFLRKKKWSIWLFILSTYYSLSTHVICLYCLKHLWQYQTRKQRQCWLKFTYCFHHNLYSLDLKLSNIFSEHLVKTTLMNCHSKLFVFHIQFVKKFMLKICFKYICALIYYLMYSEKYYHIYSYLYINKSYCNYFLL